MLEQELHWERDLFFFLNGSDSPFWDNFFYLYSGKWIWLPFYAVLLFLIIYKRPWKEVLLTAVAIAVVITLCDQISSGIFKPLFHRERPSHHPDFKDLVDLVFDHRGGGFGFISSHAANAFGLATFLALLFRNKICTYTLLIYALLTAYSRIYLGMHFVSDVVAGSLVGVGVAFSVYWLYNWGRVRWKLVERNEMKQAIYPSKRAATIGYAYLIFVAILLVFHNQLVNL